MTVFDIAFAENMASNYLQKLDPPSKKRYLEKITVMGNVDPYFLLSSNSFSTELNLPAVTYPDIVNYLVFSPSPYTAEDMKAYKSLEAYNQVIEG